MKIELKNVDYIYNEDREEKSYALKSINLEINKHEIIGLIGQTAVSYTHLTLPTNREV